MLDFAYSVCLVTGLSVVTAVIACMMFLCIGDEKNG